MNSPTERLLALFDGHRLSPAQRRIAQYLLAHLPESALLSSVDLASRAGVSQPSVTRFAVALGFSGYPALRTALRPIVLGMPGPIEPENGQNELQGAVAAELDHLRTLQQRLADPAAITGLAGDLAASTPLCVLGLRISAALAQYFAYAARQIHPDVRVVTTGGSAACDALAQARDAGATWLLAFAMPRYPKETVQALGFARSAGLRTAVVTDVPLVPFAADVVLPVGVGSRSESVV